MSKNNITFAVVDLETTGSSAVKDKIFDLAIIITDGVKILEEFETKINPNQPIPKFIQRMTKVNLVELLVQPEFSTIIKKIEPLLNNKIFVAHNVKFDYQFIKETFKNNHIDFNAPKLCTLQVVKKLKPELKKYNVGFLADYYNIPLEKRHSAYGDAKATALFFIKFISEFGMDKIKEFIK